MFGIGSAETNIKAVITAEDKGSHVLKGFGDNVSSMGGLITKGLQAGAIALAAAGAAAVAFGASSVKAFSESENIGSQLNAVLKSTGGVAGVTADQAIKLSKSLEHLSGVSDETVLNAENVLLTFTAIKKDIFPQATKAALDMATSLNHGMTPSMEMLQEKTVLLGKALQDPDAGLGALHRVGVNVEELKKKFTEGMTVQEKQKLILQELNTEFGHSAELAGKTLTGKLNILKESFNDVQENIGGVIAKAFVPLIDKGLKVIEAIDWDGVIKDSTTALRLLGDAITGNDPKLQKGEEKFSKFAEIMKDFESIIKNLEKSGKGALEGLKQAWDYLQPSVEHLWHTVKDELFPALQKLWKEVLEPLAPVIGAVLVIALGLLIDTLSATIQAIANVIKWVADLGEYFGVTLPGYIQGGVNTIKTSISTVGGFFRDAFNGVKDTVLGAWRFIANLNWGDLFSGIGRSLVNGMIALIEGALKGALKGLPGNIESKIHLPRFAKGVQNFSGGLAVVGEEGAEVVELPRGSNVIPHNQIGSSSNNGQTNIVVNIGLYAGSEQEKRKVGMELLKSIQDVASSRGTTIARMFGI